MNKSLKCISVSRVHSRRGYKLFQKVGRFLELALKALSLIDEDVVRFNVGGRSSSPFSSLRYGVSELEDIGCIEDLCTLAGVQRDSSELLLGIEIELN